MPGARRRGKKQLRVDESRRWLRVALERAEKEPGAVAACCALLMGLRGLEIVNRVGRDLDDDGWLLWVDETKTDAGRRVVRVPEELRPHLLRLAEKAGPEGRLWPRKRPWVLKQVKKLCAAANVPEVTAHGLVADMRPWRSRPVSRRWSSRRRSGMRPFTISWYY